MAEDAGATNFGERARYTRSDILAVAHYNDITLRETHLAMTEAYFRERHDIPPGSLTATTITYGRWEGFADEVTEVPCRQVDAVFVIIRREWEGP